MSAQDWNQYLPTRKKTDLRLWGWPNGEYQRAGTEECHGFWSAALLTHAAREALATLQPPFRRGSTRFQMSLCHKGQWPAHSGTAPWARWGWSWGISSPGVFSLANNISYMKRRICCPLRVWLFYHRAQNSKLLWKGIITTSHLNT